MDTIERRSENDLEVLSVYSYFDQYPKRYRMKRNFITELVSYAILFVLLCVIVACTYLVTSLLAMAGY